MGAWHTEHTGTTFMAIYQVLLYNYSNIWDIDSILISAVLYACRKLLIVNVDSVLQNREKPCRMIKDDEVIFQHSQGRLRKHRSSNDCYLSNVIAVGEKNCLTSSISWILPHKWLYCILYMKPLVLLCQRRFGQTRLIWEHFYDWANLHCTAGLQYRPADDR